MRIYKNFKEALSEIKRDLVETGVKVHPKTYQDKNVENDPDFEAWEIANYVYTVTKPKPRDLKPTQPWADLEFEERLSEGMGEGVNPGEAYKRRREVWDQFLNQGKFAYTYSERLSLCNQIYRIVERIKEDPDSRQLYISIWQVVPDITRIGGWARVPCSLGYFFKMNQDKLDITYLQRSADFVTHLENDIYLAHLLQVYVSGRAEVPVGNFTHWIGSLHIFKKDGKGVF